MLLKHNLITLELRHAEINISSRARIVHLAKNQSDYSFLPEGLPEDRMNQRRRSKVDGYSM